MRTALVGKTAAAGVCLAVKMAQRIRCRISARSLAQLIKNKLLLSVHWMLELELDRVNSSIAGGAR